MSKKYGLLSANTEESEVIIFRKEGISKDNIVRMQYIQNLANVLRTGDTVYVLSVRAFFSLNDFMQFAAIVMNVHASLKIYEQPSLSIRNGKIWNESICQHIKNATRLESEAIQYLMRYNVQPSVASQCIWGLCKRIFSESYSKSSLK